jgi:hypothetical protein
MELMKKIILIFIAISINGCVLFPPDKKQKFSPESLGGGLLNSFEIVNKSCGLFFPADIDSDILLSRSSDLNLQARRIKGTDLSGILGFVYDTKNIDEFKKGRATPNRYLNISDKDPIKVKNENNLYYAYTCTKALKNIAHADANASFTAASINSAVDVETNSSKRRDLVLSQGTFDSPVTYNLNNGTQTDKTKQYFDFLKLYENNPSLSSGEHWYLDRMYGWFVSWASYNNDMTNAKLRLDTNASYLTIGASNKLSYGLSDSVKLELNDFDFFIIPYDQSSPIENSYHFEKLPSIANVATYLKNSSVYKSYDDPDYLYAVKGGIQKHIQVIPGMPNNLCNKSNWNIESSLPGLSINQALFDNGECKFVINFERESDTQNSNFIVLNYDLVYTNNVANIPIKISTSAKVPALNEPLLITQNSETNVKDNFRFSIPIRVSSPNLIFTVESIDPLSGKIKCANEEADISLSINKDTNGFLFIVGTVPMFNTKVDSCNVNGIFQVTGRGHDSQKSFSLTSNSLLHILYN